MRAAPRAGGRAARPFFGPGAAPASSECGMRASGCAQRLHRGSFPLGSPCRWARAEELESALRERAVRMPEQGKKSIQWHVDFRARGSCAPASAGLTSDGERNQSMTFRRMPIGRIDRMRGSREATFAAVSGLGSCPDSDASRSSARKGTRECVSASSASAESNARHHWALDRGALSRANDHRARCGDVRPHRSGRCISCEMDRPSSDQICFKKRAA
jgi:hypothetical protein